MRCCVLPLKKTAPDFILILSTMLLLAIGLIMVYSASAVWADYKFSDSFFFAKRQFLFAALGIVAMFIIMHVDYWVLKKWSKPLLILCFVLLVLVIIPGVGMVRNGSRSWLGVGAFSIQPSEFIKLAMIAFLAKFLSEKQRYITTLKKGLLPSLSLVFLGFGIIMLQPDLGTGTVMVGTCMIMYGWDVHDYDFYCWCPSFTFCSIRHDRGGGIYWSCNFSFIGLVISAPYRVARITSFLDPWQDPLKSGFQIIQSLYAIGPGGLFGLGLGESRQKFFYLPEPQTDFIFAILAEELGFIGGTEVVLFYYYLPYYYGGE